MILTINIYINNSSYINSFSVINASFAITVSLSYLPHEGNSLLTMKVTPSYHYLSSHESNSSSPSLHHHRASSSICAVMVRNLCGKERSQFALCVGGYRVSASCCQRSFVPFCLLTYRTIVIRISWEYL